AALQIAPGLTEPGGVRGRQGDDVESPDATLTRLEFRFRLAAAAELVDGVAVLRAEPLHESIRLLSAAEQPCDQCQQCKHCNDAENQCSAVQRVHGVLLNGDPLDHAAAMRSVG